VQLLQQPKQQKKTPNDIHNALKNKLSDSLALCMSFFSCTATVIFY